MAGVAAWLRFGITADTSKFEKAMHRSKRSMSSFERSMRSVTAAAKGFLLGFASVSTVRALHGVAMEMDRLAKTADKLGIASQKLAGLRYMGGQKGVGANVVDMAIQRMTRRVSEAGVGQGEARGALKELRLDAGMLSGMSPDKQLYAIADAMKRLERQSDRVRLAFKLFDSEGVAMVNMLAGGSAELKEFQKQAESLGLAVDDASIDRIEAFNDALDRLKKQFAGASMQIVIAIEPAAQKAIEFIAGKQNADGTLTGTGVDQTDYKWYHGWNVMQAAYTNMFANDRLGGNSQAEIDRMMGESIDPTKFQQRRNREYMGGLAKRGLASVMSRLGAMRAPLKNTAGNLMSLGGQAMGAGGDLWQSLQRRGWAAALMGPRNAGAADGGFGMPRMSNTALEYGTREASIAIAQHKNKTPLDDVAANTAEAAETLAGMFNFMRENAPSVATLVA